MPLIVLYLTFIFIYLLVPTLQLLCSLSHFPLDALIYFVQGGRRGGIMTPLIEAMRVTSRGRLLGEFLELYALTYFIRQGGRGAGDSIGE